MRSRRRIRKDSFHATDLLIGLLFACLFLSLGALLALYLRPLYYLNIDLLSIPARTGLTEAAVQETYRAIADYLLPLRFEALSVTALPISAAGVAYLREIKLIFTGLHIAALASLLLCIPVLLLKISRLRFAYMKTCFLLPPILGALLLGVGFIRYPRPLLLLHQLLFGRNEPFQVANEPIFALFPQAYLLQCAIVVLLVILAGSLVFLLCYRTQKRLREEERLLPKKKNYYYI